MPDRRVKRRTAFSTSDALKTLCEASYRSWHH